MKKLFTKWWHVALLFSLGAIIFVLLLSYLNVREVSFSYTFEPIFSSVVDHSADILRFFIGFSYESTLPLVSLLILFFIIVSVMWSFPLYLLSKKMHTYKSRLAVVLVGFVALWLVIGAFPKTFYATGCSCLGVSVEADQFNETCWGLLQCDYIPSFTDI